MARSPLLVLRARMRGGTHDGHARALDRAAYTDRALFDYWCHEASLCHVDDLALHRWAMRTYVERLTPARAHRARWLADNAEFVDHLVEDLRARGPVRARELEDRSAAAWEWGHWTDEVSSRQTIARMLDLLWMTGRVGVGARAGIERLWDVFERCVPGPEPERLEQDEVVRRAALRAVGMLGVARAPHITAHFTRRRYPGLADALARLERDGRLERVGVEGLRGEWWARPEDLERAARLERGQPDGRAVAVRQPDLRPRPGGGAVRLRPPAGDLRARAQAPLGLLRAADPARRALRGPRRPAGGGWRAAGAGAAPRGRPGRARGHRPRVAIAGPLARRRAGGLSQPSTKNSFLSSSGDGTFMSGFGWLKRRLLPNGSRMPQSMP